MVVEPSLAKTLPRLIVLRLHLQTDGQICCEEWSLLTCFSPAFLCHWCCQTLVSVCGDLRHREAWIDTHRHHQHHQDCL